MRKLTYAVASVLLSIGSSLSAAEQATERNPNLVVILTDDQGWGDLSGQR